VDGPKKFRFEISYNKKYRQAKNLTIFFVLLKYVFHEKKGYLTITHK